MPLAHEKSGLPLVKLTPMQHGALAAKHAALAERVYVAVWEAFLALTRVEDETNDAAVVEQARSHHLKSTLIISRIYRHRRKKRVG